ncbi:MAG: hypothetical protein EZS28_036318 [Streblomastix strix]|uniref:Right handed beta helix domain-containing protein n=1 Tax=Streblomastix strix TaxID=222440 RepID=A0A5J4UEW3_9EUKA|nr:MAG: hypothetical protein EZS28_036318 [Streblomastix strix]
MLEDIYIPPPEFPIQATNSIDPVNLISTFAGCQLIFESDCQFINCSASNFIGGGMSAYINNEGSLIQCLGELLFDNCSSSIIGGGALLNIGDKASIELNKVTCIDCKSGQGAGLNIQLNFNSYFAISGQASFTKCEGSGTGGGICLINQGENVEIKLTGSIEFVDCIGNSGGGMYISSNIDSIIQITGQLSFDNCSSLYYGGGLFLEISESQLSFENLISFKDCSAETGGGIYTEIGEGGQLKLIKQSIFTECKSTSGSGGGIYSDIIDGSLNIKDTTFESCTCTQSGNGGGIALIQGISSIISITNSSFIDCKTISNSSDQRYGWGGAIFIQTQIDAENLNQTYFLMRDLIFTGSEAVNSIGNNIHIQSSNTYNTGIVIALNSLLTVKDTPNLYTSPEYSNYYMGIDQSKVIDGNEPYSDHEPLFVAAQTDSVTKQYYIRSFNSFDENDCSSTSPCKTINYILSQTLPEGFVKGLSVAIINMYIYSMHC